VSHAAEDLSVERFVMVGFGCREGRRALPATGFGAAPGGPDREGSIGGRAWEFKKGRIGERWQLPNAVAWLTVRPAAGICRRPNVQA